MLQATRNRNKLRSIATKASTSIYRQSTSTSKASTREDAAFSYKIQKAIENVGKAGNYVYIMDVSLGIPYISSTLSTDVTAAIKAEMNRLK